MLPYFLLSQHKCSFLQPKSMLISVFMNMLTKFVIYRNKGKKFLKNYIQFGMRNLYFCGVGI